MLASTIVITKPQNKAFEPRDNTQTALVYDKHGFVDDN